MENFWKIFSLKKMVADYKGRNILGEGKFRQALRKLIEYPKLFLFAKS